MPAPFRFTKLGLVRRFVLILFFFLFWFPQKIYAETFNVGPGDTAGLINAINSANSNGVADEINLSGSTYLLTTIYNSTYSKTGLPIINSEIVINGNGSTINRDSFAPNFRILTENYPGKLTLNNITISGGYDADITDNYGGGGIFNLNASLILNKCIISNNKAEVGGGGGIWIGGNTFTQINETKIINNNVGRDGSGGGLLKRGLGTTEINKSEINENYAYNVGGAIYSGNNLNGTFGGSINLNQTNIYNNSSRNSGGAIFHYSGQITIVNSCISGNSPSSVNNVSPNIISAKNNYWGHASGPSGAGRGSGDYISNDVNYLPFLTSCPPPASPSPSPTPSPSPSPSPTPEPTKIPIVLLPGLGGSWNTAAMVGANDSGTWKKTPFVKVYDNLKKTLITNAGYEENNNYFEFYYDWRKPIDQLADKFKDYLQNTVLNGKTSDTKINLVGHSMGGLVARAYTQKYGLDKINKIVTSGSPHSGAIPAWYGWAGAEVGDRWSWQWIALQLYLNAHQFKYSSPITAIRNLAPSLNNLMPVFDFAKNNQNQIINFSEMNSVNTYLANLNGSLTSDLKNLITTIGGTGQNESIEWIKLTDRNLTDKLLGRWADGRPTSIEHTTAGDLTVLQKSALINGADQTTVNVSHQELMETSSGIQAILTALDLTSVLPITDTVSPARNPSLIFWLRSPAILNIVGPDGQPVNNSYSFPDDKLWLIPNTQAGNYQIQVIGTGNGNYNLDIGQLTEAGETWNTIQDDITTGATDNYQINFNPQSPSTNPLTNISTQNYLDMAKYRLNQLKTYVNNQNISLVKKIKFRLEIDKIIKLIDRQQTQNVITGCYALRNGQETYVKNELNEIGKLLINAFNTSITKTQAKNQLDGTKIIFNKTQTKINQKISGENQTVGASFSLAEEFKNQSQEQFDQNNFTGAYIKALVSRILSNETVGLIK